MFVLYFYCRRTNLENALVRADYHGAFLRVVQSKCPSLVGKNGLVVQETLNTFVLIQSDNRSVVIPKTGSIFECRLNQPSQSGHKDLEWLLFGDQLRQHSGLRASKKFKPKPSVTL
jgi:ribonuclease P protein subunit POP4